MQSFAAGGVEEDAVDRGGEAGLRAGAGLVAQGGLDASDGVDEQEVAVLVEDDEGALVGGEGEVVSADAVEGGRLVRAGE